jgi:hypothetical protein
MGDKIPQIKTKTKKTKNKRSLLKENNVSLMFKGDGTDAQ